MDEQLEFTLKEGEGHVSVLPLIELVPLEKSVILSLMKKWNLPSFLWMWAFHLDYCQKSVTHTKRTEETNVCLRQRVWTAECPFRQGPALLSHTETAEGGGSKERVWHPNRRHLTKQCSADECRRSLSLSLKSSEQRAEHAILLLLGFTVSGGWRREGSLWQRDATVPILHSRMHLVLESIFIQFYRQEAAIKMLPYFVENTVLTQSEINRMWVDFIL